MDSVSEADRDTLAPLPPPSWNSQFPYGNPSYLPQNLSYIPPYSYTSTDSQSYIGSFVDGMDKSSVTGGNNSGGSINSASGKTCIIYLGFFCTILNPFTPTTDCLRFVQNSWWRVHCSYSVVKGLIIHLILF